MKKTDQNQNNGPLAELEYKNLNGFLKFMWRGSTGDIPPYGDYLLNQGDNMSLKERVKSLKHFLFRNMHLEDQYSEWRQEQNKRRY